MFFRSGEVMYVTAFLPGLAQSESCLANHSENVGRFPGEIALHFPGLRNLDKPHV